MSEALVVEDNRKDAKVATEVLSKAGLGVQLVDNVGAAVLRLNEVLEGKHQAPDLLLVDLSFPTDSGFEVLRLWKSNPQLIKIPVVVWTQMGKTEQKLCDYFGVTKMVSKADGRQGLERAVSSLMKA